jgi:vitamin B12 transporter
MSKYLLLVFLCLSHVHAEEVYELEKVQVTAKKKVSDFNFSKPAIITTSQLEAEPSGLIAPQLNQIPGVIANQNGGPGGRVSFFIRGTESRHVAFTLDGLKLNDTSNVDRQFDTAFFSSPFLRQVEVHKGPQAVLFGSDAIGGLIEMTTRKGEDHPETRVNVNGGSFGTIDTSISNDWGNKKHKGTITGYRFHSDGISRLNKKRFNSTERDSSDITQLASSSTHQWNSKLDTDILFSFLRGENELDGNTADNSNDKSRNDQYIIQQKTDLRLNKTSAISLRNGLNRHNRIIDAEFMGSNTETTFEGNLVQNEALYKYEDKATSLLGGLASEHEEAQVSGLDKSFDLHSAFLQGAYQFSDLKIYGGGRTEKHVRYGTFFTGSGGMALYANESTFFIQYSQGYKAPSLYQLYGPSFPGFKVGNSNLVPEVNHSWESGWSITNKSYDASVTVFQNRLSNIITYTDILGYFNQSRFIAEGVEISGKLKREDYHLTSSFTHQQFRKEESTVIGRPLNAFTAGVAVFPTESSEVSFRGRWYSSRQGQKDITTNVRLNGFETFDFGLRYFFTDNELGLQVLNILNREYEEVYGYSVMPRSVFVHSGFRF